MMRYMLRPLAFGVIVYGVESCSSVNSRAVILLLIVYMFLIVYMLRLLRTPYSITAGTEVSAGTHGTAIAWSPT